MDGALVLIAGAILFLAYQSQQKKKKEDDDTPEPAPDEIPTPTPTPEPGGDSGTWEVAVTTTVDYDNAGWVRATITHQGPDASGKIIFARGTASIGESEEFGYMNFAFTGHQDASFSQDFFARKMDAKDMWDSPDPRADVRKDVLVVVIGSNGHVYAHQWKYNYFLTWPNYY